MLEISTRTAAALVLRLMKPRLTPLAEAASHHEASVRHLILSTMREAQDRVPMGELQDVLSMGHPGTGAPLYIIEPVIQFIADELMGDGVTLMAPHRFLEAKKKKDLPDLLHETLTSGARVAAQPLQMSFDTLNPAAVAWAHDHAAKLIVEISEDVRDAIRLTVVDAFESGIPPRDVARVIRGNIGLTSRDAAAVMKRQLQMLADGVTSDVATKRAEFYAAKLLRRRAETIARTETMRAANEGQQQLWEQAQAKGLLSMMAMKVWITADPCPICAPLEGEEVPLNGTFSIGFDPPAHPNCRCSVGLL